MTFVAFETLGADVWKASAAAGCAADIFASQSALLDLVLLPGAAVWSLPAKVTVLILSSIWNCIRMMSS